MIEQASLLSDLQSSLGPDAVVEDVSPFAVDGLVPRAAVAPADVEQVAEVMRYAHSEALAVIPWGAGTMMRIGNVPLRYDIALSLSRLHRVLEHEPADLTVTCQAGIPLGRLQALLAGSGQKGPLDALSDAAATVGGILAANAAGPSRHAYGTARDFTIGLRVVTPDGRITKAGGRVVKNVAGYDLCKLYVGSLGTLGVIVEATFKLQPLPKAERTLVAPFDRVGDALIAARAFQQRGLALAAAALLNRAAAEPLAVDREDQRYVLALKFAGTPAAVDRSLREAEAALPTGLKLNYRADNALWPRIRDLASPAGVDVVCKASVLPSHLPAIVEAVEAARGSACIMAFPTVGVAYISWRDTGCDEENIGSLRDTVSAAGGTVVVEACPPELKQRIDVFGPPPPAFDLMRRIKQQFDPRGVLCPGRYVGRL